jgi:light-regulated signal transduction histidine kinase (bacteriophytochrome)
VLVEELLDNSWKFTGRRRKPRIEFGTTEIEGATVYFVGDNGAGFDMADYDRLFGLFMRLHSMTEFEGTGVGLTTVRAAVQRQGGNVWAEAQPGKGATFFFTLS